MLRIIFLSYKQLIILINKFKNASESNCYEVPDVAIAIVVEVELFPCIIKAPPSAIVDSFQLLINKIYID